MLTRYLQMFVLSVAMLTMQACGTRPVTPQDYLQTTKAQIGAAYKSIGDLKAQGSITQAEGRNYFDRVDALETQLNTAEKALAVGSTGSAEATLGLVVQALLAIQTDLNAKRK